MQKKSNAVAPRRRGTKEQTRRRLLEATLSVLESGGESAISTVSITREAGCAQSAFYQHFANVEECLNEVAEQVTRQIRELVADSRQEMYDTTSGVGEDVVLSYRAMFDLVDRHRSIMRLFLRYRSDPLALGGAMYRFARGLSEDLAKQLRERAKLVGMSRPPKKPIEALADHLVAASLSAVEAYLDGRVPSVEMSARLLAAFSEGACRSVFGLLGGEQKAD